MDNCCIEGGQLLGETAGGGGAETGVRGQGTGRRGRRRGTGR